MPNKTREEHYEKAEGYAEVAARMMEADDPDQANVYVSLGELELKLSFGGPSPLLDSLPFGLPAYVGNVESSGDEDDDRP